MKSIRSLGSVVVSCLGFLNLFAAEAAHAEPPTLVTAPIERVFVPLGFDDNDNVEIVLHGEFPNTCYKVGPTNAVVDPIARTITVEAQAYLYSGGCAQVIVPFIQPVRLGTVPQGQYEVRVIGRPGAQSPALDVRQSTTAAPDDHLYARVAEVSLDPTGDGGYALTISGEYPFTYVGCMVMKNVQAYMSPGNTLVVLPIAELIPDGPICNEQANSKKFSFTTPIGNLEAGDYLLHVRVIEGNSLNRFVVLD